MPFDRKIGDRIADCGWSWADAVTYNIILWGLSSVGVGFFLVAFLVCAKWTWSGMHAGRIFQTLFLANWSVSDKCIQSSMPSNGSFSISAFLPPPFLLSSTSTVQIHLSRPVKSYPKAGLRNRSIQIWVDKHQMLFQCGLILIIYVPLDF